MLCLKGDVEKKSLIPQYYSNNAMRSTNATNDDIPFYGVQEIHENRNGNASLMYMWREIAYLSQIGDQLCDMPNAGHRVA